MKTFYPYTTSLTTNDVELELNAIANTPQMLTDTDSVVLGVAPLGDTPADGEPAVCLVPERDFEARFFTDADIMEMQKDDYTLLTIRIAKRKADPAQVQRAFEAICRNAQKGTDKTLTAIRRMMKEDKADITAQLTADAPAKYKTVEVLVTDVNTLLIGTNSENEADLIASFLLARFQMANGAGGHQLRPVMNIAQAHASNLLKVMHFGDYDTVSLTGPLVFDTEQGTLTVQDESALTLPESVKALSLHRELKSAGVYLVDKSNDLVYKGKVNAKTSALTLLTTSRDAERKGPASNLHDCVRFLDLWQGFSMLHEPEKLSEHIMKREEYLAIEGLHAVG